MRYEFETYTKFSLNYETSDSTFTLSNTEIKDLLNKYLNQRVTFNVRDWFDDIDSVEYWVSDFTVRKIYKDTMMYSVKIESSCKTNDYPTLYEIGQKLGLVAPISARIIEE